MDNNHVHSGKIITDAERTQITTNKDDITGLTTSKVSVAGAENITGVKTFTNGIIIPSGQGLDGNALTATTLETNRTIAGVAFNGSANIDISVENLSDVTSKGSGAIITAAERTSIGKFDTFFTDGLLEPALDTLKELQDLIDIDSSNNVTSILSNINDISNNVKDLSDNVDLLVDDIRTDLSHNTLNALITDLSDNVKDLSDNVDVLVADIRVDLSHNTLNALITDLSGNVKDLSDNVDVLVADIATNTTNIATNTTSLSNLSVTTNAITYPTACTHVAYQQTDDTAANYIAPADASTDVVAALNTLSSSIELLATELHKLNGNKIVFNNN